MKLYSEIYVKYQELLIRGFTAWTLNFLVKLGYPMEISCFLQFWNFFRSLSLHPSMKFSSTFSPLRNSFDPIVCWRSPDSSKMKIARIVKAISISSTPSILNFISTYIQPWATTKSGRCTKTTHNDMTGILGLRFITFGTVEISNSVWNFSLIFSFKAFFVSMVSSRFLKKGPTL